MRNVIIVIPVYKDPDAFELIALRQCCSVLCNYDMALVCPCSFNTYYFQELWNEFGLTLQEERFSDVFFHNIEGYNRLLLSKEFYLRFNNYEYILIYQPDAYVFYDGLLDWCEKGYDYIGAPLVGNAEQMLFSNDMPLRVGNGGFSLRRVKAFLAFFEGHRLVFDSYQIAKNISLFKKPYTRWILWLLMMLGWHNTPQWMSKNYKWNEDAFWSIKLADSQYALNLPSVDEALGFSFERFPKEMYAITGKLPFGCHAWHKYEYDEFWKTYIK